MKKAKILWYLIFFDYGHGLIYSFFFLNNNKK